MNRTLEMYQAQKHFWENRPDEGQFLGSIVIDDERADFYSNRTIVIGPNWSDVRVSDPAHKLPIHREFWRRMVHTGLASPRELRELAMVSLDLTELDCEDIIDVLREDVDLNYIINPGDVQ